ncbi:MBL fold metallo-hydrolase [Jatrophihabitans endophyticus]|uniref:MBL fold metallo-hydrolase n=1 Tax=Jatrophihabitans endophyticus TaxID=1206085 RepID=UPI0019F29345|nr:MBL fold metallo-hydrolase [Jatrophihabitans endophyticus]MBE7190659.1 MBL fold metallo-hydrolase [Jatrophihabitans endophyticus]
MRITKLEHAALILEEAGRRLVIDPGGLTNPILDLTDVDAIVITHEHADHWTADQLHRLLDANPGVPIYGPAGVAKAAEGIDVVTVHPFETVEVAAWNLKFFGGNHAVIHPSIPVIDNVGVLVNDALYYPGDSFYVPVGVEIDTLAAPAGAPWMKISEGMDFVAQVHAKRTFPTHDGVLSAAGMGLVNARYGDILQANGGEYIALKPGETLDI